MFLSMSTYTTVLLSAMAHLRPAGLRPEAGRSALLGARALSARASRSPASCQYGSQLDSSRAGACRAAAA